MFRLVPTRPETELQMATAHQVELCYGYSEWAGRRNVVGVIMVPRPIFFVTVPDHSWSSMRRMAPERLRLVR